MGRKPKIVPHIPGMLEQIADAIFAKDRIIYKRKRLSAKSIKMCKVLVLSLLFLLAPMSSQATEKFELFNDCKQIGLVVEALHEEESKKINLTREAIVNSVESRLRSARIYNENSYEEYLYVRVSVVGRSFSNEIQFNKSVLSYGEIGMATTWEEGRVGIHGRTGADFILSSLSKLIDKFLVEYFRVNQKYCK